MQMEDPDGFIVALHRKDASAMLRYAYRFTGDFYIAQDLVQETFLTAMLKREELQKHPAPRLWLFTTLRYKIMREMDKAYRKAECAPIGEEAEAREQLPEKLEDSLPKGLSGKEREILILRFENEFSYEEIAEKKGIAQAACRQQLSRAVKHCRTLLAEEKTMSQSPCLTGFGK